MWKIVKPNFIEKGYKVLKEFDTKDEALLEFKKDEYNFCGLFYEPEHIKRFLNFINKFFK